MDSDEEEGLRAFGLTVGASAGARYPERPQWIEHDGERTEIAAVEAEWREEERLGYRVRLADDRSLLLYYVPELDLWSGVWPDRGLEGMVRGRH